MAAHQFGEIESEGLEEELGMIGFPAGAGGVEGVENILHLPGSRGMEEAPVLAVEFEYGPGLGVRFPALPAGIAPELLAPGRRLDEGMAAFFGGLGETGFLNGQPELEGVGRNARRERGFGGPGGFIELAAEFQYKFARLGFGQAMVRGVA